MVNNAKDTLQLALKKTDIKLNKVVKILLITVLSLVSIAVIFSCTLSIIEYIKYVKLDNKSEFTVEEVEDAVKIIFKQNMGYESWVSVRNADKKSRFDNYPDYQEISKMFGDQFVVSTSGGDSIFSINGKPNEITASFDCILYFEDKNLPGELFGIVNAQTIGGIDNAYSNMTFISFAEYEKLRQEIDISGMSRRKAAKKLAEVWIEKHNYVKK